MSAPAGSPQRIVGLFACTAPDGTTQLLEVALEPRHWRALYDATAKRPEPASVLAELFQALDQVPADRFDDEVARYVEAMHPGLPARLGALT